MEIKTWPGEPYPLGAVYHNDGTNFALFAENAEAVELCLFDAKGNETRVKVLERTHNSWHIFLPGIRPGQRYAYRVYGPYEPQNGHRYNAAKLLLDPYARAISGNIDWHDSLFGYEIGHAEEDLSLNETNDAARMPKCIVAEDSFDWEGDRPLGIPMHKTIIYELHVKGFSQLSQDLPDDLKGTFAGLAHPASIGYFKDLGINAVELMPIHHFVHDRHLVDAGLQNYWGYNTIGFFAPHADYAAAGTDGAQIKEFKEMVKGLHAAGIEVILDVVYNHTAEGSQLGPTLSFRGIDNASYYRLSDEDRRYYVDYTGTGNTLNTVHPTVLRLIMDSLRYWAIEMHVDGFRFDLAPVLAREFDDVDKWGSFFDVLHQDPVLSQVKLIAEPWDLGENGFQVGNFPAGWMEWNAKYRDCMRQFWRGDEEMLPEFANRLTGSSDLYLDDWRTPTASINFITAHDGFTLADLVSYNEKHNEANFAGNESGEDHNRSWNCGAEGPTDDSDINELRQRQIRNFLVTLFLSQGVPMLLAGDELGRTQNGNNNAYCQDNEMSWINWAKKDEALLAFCSKLIHFRQQHPVFCRRKWFKNSPVKGSKLKAIEWFTVDGQPMTDEHWQSSPAKSLGIFLYGDGVLALSEHGATIHDDSFFLIFNAHHGAVRFRLPEDTWAGHWQLVLNTYDPVFHDAVEEGERYAARRTLDVPGRTILLFQTSDGTVRGGAAARDVS